MMRHFIGKVYLYHKPPHEEHTLIDAPIYSHPEKASEAILFLVDEEDIGFEGVERREKIVEATGLTAEIIQRFGNLGIDNLTAVKGDIRKLLDKNAELLTWKNFPTKKQRDAVFSVVFKRLIWPNRYRIGARSGTQLSLFLDKLRTADTLSTFFSWLLTTTWHSDPELKVEMGFEFLRACEFNIPTALMACEAITNLLGQDEKLADWRLYATSLKTTSDRAGCGH